MLQTAISDLLWPLGGATWSLQKDLWLGVEVTVRWQDTGRSGGWCSGAAAEETSPRRCRTCTVSCPAGYAAPYLTVFSENAVDVFDVRKAEWVQTVPLKKVRAARTPGPGPGLGGCWAAGLTSVPVASGATPKPGGLPVSLWHGEGPPDLPQEPAGR